MSEHGQPWPVGAYFLTFVTDEDGKREIHYQGRILAFDGTTMWGELYSWMDGGATGIHAIPQDDLALYTSDVEMRRASFEYYRYRWHYIGTFEENDGLFGPVVEHSWTAPLPAGFETKVSA